MKRTSTLFLKVVLIVVATLTLTLLLWMPQLEGRATNLDLISIYTDPLIIYLYIASIPFFSCFYQAFKLLGYIEKNSAFSQPAVNALANIKYASLSLIGFITVAVGWIMIGSGEDDPAGAIALGLYIAFAAVVVATAAAVFQRLLQNAVDLKSENDLTV